MPEIIISIWFIVIFIPAIYVVYNCLQCFDYEKILKKGKVKEFKIVYLIGCVGIAFLFASAFTTLIERIYDIANRLAAK